jgi:hypothetical protein
MGGSGRCADGKGDMNRRMFLIRSGATALLPVVASSCRSSPPPVGPSRGLPFRRVRPSDPSWPDPASWARLNQQVGGQLIKVRSPLTECATAPDGRVCADFFRRAKNPYYLGDDVEAMYRHVVKESWPRAAELTRRPWGLTDFRVMDPDGYYWRVTSRT